MPEIKWVDKHDGGEPRRFRPLLPGGRGSPVPYEAEVVLFGVHGFVLHRPIRRSPDGKSWEQVESGWSVSHAGTGALVPSGRAKRDQEAGQDSPPNVVENVEAAVARLAREMRTTPSWMLAEFVRARMVVESVIRRGVFEYQRPPRPVWSNNEQVCRLCGEVIPERELHLDPGNGDRYHLRHYEAL